MAAAPWSRDDPRLRARLMEALGGVVLVAGRHRRDGAALRTRRSRSGETHRRRGRARQRLLQRLVHVRRHPRIGGRATADPDRIGLALPRGGARHLPPHRRRARRGERPLGARQLPLLPARMPGNGVDQFREALDDLPRGRRPDDGGLVPAHARDRAAAQGRGRRGARRHRSMRSATSMRPATPPGSP